jgi:hypothetical protein
MPRLVFLGLIALILNGCGVTDQNVPSSTTVAGQPAVQSPQPPEAAPGEEPTTPPTTATSSPDALARAERATLATAWQQANKGGAEAKALLYFGASNENESPLMLWRFPLDSSGTPQRVSEAAWSPLGTPIGELSPNRQWVAYIIGDQPTPGFELHLLRTDGSSDRVVFLIGPHNDCFPQFVWVPGTSTLVYRVGSGGFRHHDPETATEHEFARFDGAKILGIDSQDRVLVSVLRGYDQPRDIVAIDPLTGMQEVLAAMPRTAEQSFFCRKWSPNGHYLLFGMGEASYQPYLFNTVTGQTQETDIVPNQAFWAQDSQHILTFGDGPMGTVSVRTMPEMPVVARAVLPPAGPGLDRPGIRSTSPDGQWLVGCFGNGSPQQSWLYHMPTQTWRQLSSGSTCINVVGWMTQ